MPMARRSSGRGGGGPGVEVTMVMALAAAEGEDNVIIISRPDQAGLGCNLYSNISSSSFASPAAVIPSTSCPEIT